MTVDLVALACVCVCVCVCVCGIFPMFIVIV
jgi:hypothetical protein